MRQHFDDFQRHLEPEVIAMFGEARLVKHLDGRLEIVGGSEQDRADAHAWMKQFNIQSAPLTLRRAR